MCIVPVAVIVIVIPVENIPEDIIIQGYMRCTVSVETVESACQVIILHSIIIALGIHIITVVICRLRLHYIHRVVDVNGWNIVKH